MRALLQRVREASVSVDNQIVGQIGPGLLIFVCAMPGDSDRVVNALAAKVSKLRVFKDDAGKINLSLVQSGGSALVVSQFTLAADMSRGNRPGFSGAAPPNLAEAMYNQFADALTDLGIETERGRFGADMRVALVNDGPVTIWIDTDG